MTRPYRLYDASFAGVNMACVISAVESAAVRANSGCRVRRVPAYHVLGTLRSAPGLTEARRTDPFKPDGVYGQLHGFDVGRAPPFRSHVSVVELAWFTAADGVVHVRVYGDRVQIGKGEQPSRHFGLLRHTFANTHPFTRVYPEITTPTLDNAEVVRLCAGQVSCLNDNPLDLPSWCSLLDRLHEEGSDDPLTQYLLRGYREAYEAVVKLHTVLKNVPVRTRYIT